MYHDNYKAKRLETGFVIAGSPRENVVRRKPIPGDIIVLVGGDTGRDGCGGATGSSKAHTEKSVEVCGAEVQKGNPPVSCKHNCHSLLRLGNCKLGACQTIIFFRNSIQGNIQTICKLTNGNRNLKRAFIDTNGVKQMQDVVINDNVATYMDSVNDNVKALLKDGNYTAALLAELSRPNVCSTKGLGEMFDSTIGASSVLMPFGGKNQLTPSIVMAAKPPTGGKTDTTTVSSFACSPYLYKAPSNADVGSPQRFASLPSFLKNSCKVKRIVDFFTPLAINFEMLATML